MFQALLLFTTLATLTHGLRTRLHAKLQVDPDPICQQWLNTSAGQEFLACDSGNPGLPVPTNSGAGCQVTAEDFNAYCNDTCFATMTKAYDFFLNTGTCLPVYEDKYKPCSNDTECPTLGNGIARMCHQGFCYNTCNNNSDCNACIGESCMSLGGSNTQACWNNNMYHQNGSAAVNHTMVNAFRGMIYSLKAGCAKNENGSYCGLMQYDLENQTCQSLESEWGCCVNTALPAMKWCQWSNFTNASYAIFHTCGFTATSVCTTIDPYVSAYEYCTFDKSGLVNSSSSSSSSSSSWSGSSSSMSSGNTGVGNTGNGNGNGNGASGQAVMSWAMTIGLVLAAAHIVS